MLKVDLNPATGFITARPVQKLLSEFKKNNVCIRLRGVSNNLNHSYIQRAVTFLNDDDDDDDTFMMNLNS